MCSSFIGSRSSGTAAEAACATWACSSQRAQPRSSFGDQYAHEGLYAMAAAYLFHIARNHPFVDGNKRTALLAALVFLDINGITVERESEALYELTMGVAEGLQANLEFSSWLPRPSIYRTWVVARDCGLAPRACRR